MKRGLYSNTFYNLYAKNVHSQNGEDGIIQELFSRLGIENGWVCEFGAWDGIHLSNTFNLVKTGKFKAVFIEGDPIKFKDLLKTQKQYPNIIPIQEFVDHNQDSNYNLDSLLQQTDIPKDFELLSIDIDSFDYQVWKSLEYYKPKIVIIEINSGINPNSEDHIHSPGKYSGTSFNPTLKLGQSKGYTFLLHTGNMFFIRNDLLETQNKEEMLKDIKYEDPLENFRTNWLGR